VVVVKVPLTPPIVSVVVVEVEFVEAEVWRTRTVSPLLTVPAADVHEPLLLLYSLELAPLTEIDAGELIPLTVMASEVLVWFRFTLVVSDVKLNALGVVSIAPVVTEKVPLTPPIVRVAVVVVEKLDDDVTRTLIVPPLSIVPELT
jgi:hypothetical protein